MAKRAPEEDAHDWTASSNSAIHMRLCAQPVTNSDSNSDEGFNPEFTYVFYGQEEQLQGFLNPRINVLLSASSLRPYIAITYDDKDHGVSRRQLLDPLLEHMFPHCNAPPKEGEEWASDVAVLNAWIREDEEFVPPGDLVHSYTLDDGDRYELYQASLGCARVKALNRRFQALLLFFIEGASFLDDSDDRWQLFFLFKRTGDTSVEAVGFVSCYPFYLFPDKTRMRISQVFILPPFQSLGHGGRLYRFLYDKYAQDDQIAEITVEDPTEAFSDLRTRNDLARLAKDGALIIKDTLPSEQDLEAVRRQYKFSRFHATSLFEMHILKQIPPSLERAYRLWVKKRIYRKNEEALVEMPKAEVKQKLAETYDNVVDDYLRILDALKSKRQ